MPRLPDGQADEARRRRWGVGRKLGCTIYARADITGIPSAEDIWIGVMHDPRIATLVCETHNRAVALATARGETP